MIKLTPSTKRSDLPEEFSEKQIQTLEINTYYPAHFYNATTGIKRPDIAISDFEKGVINPDDVRFRGFYRPFRKRRVGEKTLIMIKGRELKRIYKEGRTLGLHAKSIRERTSA